MLKGSWHLARALGLFAALVVAPTRPALPAAGPEELPRLSPGSTLDLPLTSGASRSFRLDLQTGEVAHVVVEQQGIDVVVALFDPAGSRVAAMDSPNSVRGHEHLWAVAEIAGPHRLEVRALHAEAPDGAVEIRVVEIRQAEDRDRLRAAAGRAYMEGLELHSLETVEALDRVRELHRRALALYRAADEPFGEAVTLYWLATDAHYRSELWEVEEPLERARALWIELGEAGGEAETLMALGAFYRAAGRVEVALQRYEEALALWRRLGHLRGEAKALGHMGSIYEQWGELEDARSLMAQAVELWHTLGDRRSEAYRLYTLGRAYRLGGDLDQALEHDDEALALWKELGGRPGREAWALGESARVLADRGDPAAALRRLNEELALWQRMGNRIEMASTLVDLGDLHAAIGDHEKARELYLRALELAGELEERRSRAAALEGLARLDRGRGDLEGAMARLEESIGIIESLRVEGARPGIRAAYLAAHRRTFELYVDVLMELDRLHPEAGFDARALAAAERSRARSLLDVLGETGSRVRAEADPELLAQEVAARRRLSAADFRRQQVLSAPASEEEAEAARRELRESLAEYRAVEGRLRAQSPRYAALTRPEPLELPRIEELVAGDETLLLEYFLGEERSFLWAVTASGMRSFELPPREELESAARQAYELLTARGAGPVDEHPRDRLRRVGEADARYLAASAALSATLLGPVADLLAGRRLAVVPDGALQYLPFAALPDPASPDGGGDGARDPLIAHREVVQLPSASVLAVQRKLAADRPRPPGLVAVIADPVFDLRDPRVAALPYPTQDRDPSQALSPGLRRVVQGLGLIGFQRLRFSRREAYEILDLAPGADTLSALDFAASKELVTGDGLASYRLLHFATHGILDTRHPELSGLVLSLVDEEGRFQDGYLRLPDIYNLDLSADLVTLSACQTALGKEIRGEGLVGLTRGFLHAGAERVVASLWSVQDNSTAELMERFYRGILEEGLRPAEALRRAQTSMLAEERWRAPYHWAGFVLQGEWR